LIRSLKPNPHANHINADEIKADYIFLYHTVMAIMLPKPIPIAKAYTGHLCRRAEVAGWFEKNGIKKVHPLITAGPIKFDFGEAAC
jgi:hypothetical protein